MWQDIAINLLSDLIFVALAIFLAWLYYLLTKRRQLIKFFGIEKSRRIIIYLSKLDVIRGGSAGIDSLPRSFQGKAIANEEAKVASLLQTLFNYFLPSWGDKPGILSKLLIADIDVQIVISPASTHEIEQSATFIALGSSAYNAASKFMDTRPDALGKIDLVPIHYNLSPNAAISDFQSAISSATVTSITGNVYDGGTVVPSGLLMEPHSENAEQKGSLPTGTPVDIPNLRPRVSQPAIIINGKSPIIDPRTGYLERIYDREKQRSLFCAAGISELATAGAAYYLKDKWQELNKKYGATKSFLVLLKFESSDYRQPVVLFEKGERI